jgi:hypothetical protein
MPARTCIYNHHTGLGTKVKRKIAVIANIISTYGHSCRPAILREASKLTDFGEADG